MENDTRLQAPDTAVILRNVQAALAEDVGNGDITATLIPPNTRARATVISRESGILCGKAWVECVFAELSPAISLQWKRADGEALRSSPARTPG